MADSPSVSGPVLLFDGVCNLCSASVRFVIRHDRTQRFRFSALQSDAGRELLARHGRSAAALDTIVLVDGERCRTRSDAAIAVLTGLGGLWKAASLLRLAPRVLRDAVYSWVAKNRYAWFGRQQECSRPTPELNARFLPDPDA